MAEETFSRQEAARRLVAWTGLGAPVRASVADTVARVGLVQLDPMQVVAPAHLWTLSLRRGPTRLQALDRALAGGEVLEAHCGVRSVVHVRDAPAMVAGWRRRRANNHTVRYGVVDAARHVMRVAERGEAFTSRALDVDERVTGFWDAQGVRRTKATSVAVDLLWAEGRLAVVGRRGGSKLYRLVAQHLPAVDHLIETLSPEEAERAAVLHSLRAWGLVWSAGLLGWGALGTPAARRTWTERLAAEGAAVPVRLADAPRTRLFAARDLVAMPAGRSARQLVLAPLDNLLWHRPRLEALFGFHYRWEAYTPAHKRSGSAYNMPILTGDKFWGEADARWRDGRLEVRLRPTGVGGQGTPPAAVSRAVAGAGRLAAALRAAPEARRPAVAFDG